MIPLNQNGQNLVPTVTGAQPFGFTTGTLNNMDTPAVLLGDVNLDGMVNFLDIVPFTSRLASTQFEEEADANLDGAVNVLDIAPFISLLSSH